MENKALEVYIELTEKQIEEMDKKNNKLILENTILKAIAALLVGITISFFVGG